MQSIQSARLATIQPLTLRHIGLCIATVVALYPVSSIAQSNAEDQHATFVAGLREFGLHELAADYCAQQLGRSDIRPDERAELTLQHMQVYSALAAELPGNKGRTAWTNAHSIAADFQRKFPQHPRLRLIEVQDALTYLAQCDQLRQEAESSPAGDALLKDAQSHLRTAAKKLTELGVQLPKDIARSEQGAANSLSAAELLSLHNNVQFQLARTHLAQSRSHNNSPLDQKHMLSRVIDVLQKPLTQLAVTDPLFADCVFELSTAHRLLGELNEASSALRRLPREALNPQVAVRWRAEQIRLQIAARARNEVQKLLAQGRAVSGVTSPELDLAILEGLLFLLSEAQRTNNGAAATRYENQATAKVRQIEDAHGPYFGRVASRTIVAVAGNRGQGNWELLERTAQEHYLKQRYTDAIAAYDRAADVAFSSKQLEKALQLRCTAAEVARKQGEIGECVRRLRQATIATPQFPNAPSNHLAAIQLANQLVRGKEYDPKAFRELLVEHIKAWPGKPSANVARHHLGIDSYLNKDYNAAVNALLQVTPDYDQFARVLVILEKAWPKRIANLQSGEKTAEINQALSYLDTLCGMQGQLNPNMFTTTMHRAILINARFRMAFRSTDLRRITDVIQLATQTRPPPPPTWVGEATATLIPLFILQGNQAAAEAIVTNLPAKDHERQLQLVRDLDRIRQQSPPISRSAVAKIEGQVVKLLKQASAAMSEKQRLALANYEVESLMDQKDFDGSIKLLNGLTKQYPKSLKLQIQLAQAYENKQTKASLQTALQRWRLILKRTRPRSNGWYQAKLSLATVYEKLGQSERAHTLLELLKIQYGWEESSYRKSFDALHQQTKK